MLYHLSYSRVPSAGIVESPAGTRAQPFNQREETGSPAGEPGATTSEG